MLLYFMDISGCGFMNSYSLYFILVWVFLLVLNLYLLRIIDGASRRLVTVGVAILVPCYAVKSLRLIRRSGTRMLSSFHHQVFKWVAEPWRQYRQPGVLCNIWYPSKTHLKLKSREISFVHNIRFSCPIVLKFCTEHGSITAVLCATFRDD